MVTDPDVNNFFSTTTSTEKTSASSNTQKSPSSPSKTSTSKPSQNITPDAVPSIPTEAELAGSVFRLTSYNGVNVPTDAKYSLSFRDGYLSVNFCNNISGRYILDGNSVKADNLLSTLMYCSSPENIMEIESAFVSMLNYGAIIYKSDNKIILSYSKGTVMVFAEF